MNRPTLSLELDPIRHGSRCPVHKSHCLALVGEAPGPNTREDLPLYPVPERSAAGRLCAMLGQGRRGYLGSFARANLIARYPGDRFPLREAAELSERLAQRLAPRPLILLGRGVSHAFRFPSPEHMIWEDYLLGSTLIRAATLPHPSGRNLWYNDPVNRIRVGEWLREQVRAHSQE